MGIAVGGFAMGRPARVGDALPAAEFVRLEGIELAHPALALGDPELALVADRDAGRVVAAILQPMQAFEQDGRRLTLADVADDAAHEASPNRRRCGAVAALCRLAPRSAGGSAPAPAVRRSRRSTGLGAEAPGGGVERTAPAARPGTTTPRRPTARPGRAPTGWCAPGSPRGLPSRSARCCSRHTPGTRSRMEYICPNPGKITKIECRPGALYTFPP